jgi:hypothetical protein
MNTSFPNTCKKAFVTEQELFEGLRCRSYEALHARVSELVVQNRLSPVRSSGINGRIPALFNRYRIIRAQEPPSSHQQEITRLHPLFHIEGYLAEPARYEGHRALLLPLNDALGKRPGWLSARMSLNEKSFLLYGDEKRLVRERRRMEAILAFNSLSWSLFQAYETPEPFFSWNLAAEQPEPGMTASVLVLENKDIWYTLMDLSREYQVSGLFPENVTCLIYGEGNKVCREHGTLTEYLDQVYPNARAGRIWYAGDLDAEGVRIWQRLCLNNPELSLGLHRPLYQAMAAWARNVWNGQEFQLPEPSDDRRVVKLTEREWETFLLEMGMDVLYHQEESAELAKALATGGRIPQEVTNRMVLRELLGLPEMRNP